MGVDNRGFNLLNSNNSGVSMNNIGEGILDIVSTPKQQKQNMIDQFDKERFPEQWKIYEASAPLRDGGLNTAQIAKQLNKRGDVKSPRGHELDKNHIDRAIRRVETGRHA